MMKAGRALKILFPKMIHANCVAHILHNVCETIRDTYSKVDRLIAEIKKVFLKAPNRIKKLKMEYPDIALPPKPVLTRWGSWILAAVYYANNFNRIKKVVEMLDESEAASVAKAKKLFNVGIIIYFFFFQMFILYVIHMIVIFRIKR
jgi:hypothetical protein